MRRKPNSDAPELHNEIKSDATLQELTERFDEELKRRYWAEKTVLDLLPTLEKSVTSYELTRALQFHARVTSHQIDRLLHIFDILGERALVSKELPMLDLLVNAQSAFAAKPGFERDEAIFNLCRRIMNYEISVYEKLSALSKNLKQQEIANYIQQSIDEEREAQALFSHVEIKAIYSE